jgi:hypothetical protein
MLSVNVVEKNGIILQNKLKWEFRKKLKTFKTE